MRTSHRPAKVDAPEIKTVQAEGRWKGDYRTDLAVRDFRFVIAEPEKIGGKNEAPTPMEYVLGALNGCLSVVVELVAKERGIVLRDLKISSSGLVDQRGLFGTADVSPHFQSVEVAVTMATSAPSTELTALQLEVLKRCPVYNLIRDSKARISVTWSVAAVASRMNTYGYWVVGLAVGYTALLIVAARIARTKAQAGAGSYFVGGRQFSPLLVALCVTGLFSGSTFIAVLELSYLKGVSAAWYGVAESIQVVLIGSLVGPFRERALITISGLIGDRYGRSARAVAGAITAFAFPMWSVATALAFAPRSTFRPGSL